MSNPAEIAAMSDSVSERLKALKELGAAMSKIIIRDKEGRPIAAAIFVQGQPETGEIVDAINAAEESW